MQIEYTFRTLKNAMLPNFYLFRSQDSTFAIIKWYQHALPEWFVSLQSQLFLYAGVVGYVRMRYLFRCLYLYQKIRYGCELNTVYVTAISLSFCKRDLSSSRKWIMAVLPERIITEHPEALIPVFSVSCSNKELKVIAVGFWSGSALAGSSIANVMRVRIPVS